MDTRNLSNPIQTKLMSRQKGNVFSARRVSPRGIIRTGTCPDNHRCEDTLSVAYISFCFSFGTKKGILVIFCLDCRFSTEDLGLVTQKAHHRMGGGNEGGFIYRISQAENSI